MPIVPLPQFEADLKAHLDEQDRQAYEALQPPKTVVVRYGSMKMIGEFPYSGSAKPGCGSKLVVRTFRGTEVGEMLTSTCPNSGCSKSVSRQEMLQYIENSGGRDYPFATDGRVLRIATPQDLDAQSRLEQSKHALKVQAKAAQAASNAPGGAGSRTPIKIVEVEPILGGETLTVYYTTATEERVEVRDLGREIGRALNHKAEMRHVGARDEARLTADYERCGQYCCCKNFLKVLKPVSMKSAKVQKATLDPLKISGRCGRLMCCLRYEDSTYEDLRKRLPRKKSRVGTPEGDGTVLDSQILTQLVLIELDAPGDDGKPKQIAVAVEDLTPPVSATPPPPSSAPARSETMGAGPRRFPPREGPAQAPGPRPDRAGPDRAGSDRATQDRSGQDRAPGDRAMPPRAPRPNARPLPPREGPQRDGPPREGQSRQGPPRPGPRPGPPQGPRPAPRQAPPPDTVDDILDDIETDFGDARRPNGGPGGSGSGPNGGPNGGPNNSGNPGPDGPRRRRRRRRGPGGPSGSGPSGSGPSGGSPPPSAP